MSSRRPPFINPSTGGPRQTRAALPRAIVVVAAFFVIVVIGCAGLYKLGSGHGWGIQSTFSPNPSPTAGFLECLHFSIITITTVGYGDYRPESYSRLVADAEAVTGVILMGILVSQLVSRQQDRLTRWLVSGQFNTEAKSFRAQLEPLISRYDERRGQPYSAETSELFYKTDGLAKALARYWRYASSLPELNEIAQLKVTGRILGDLVKILKGVQALTNGLTADTIREEDRTSIRNITESSLAVAAIVEDQLMDEDLNASCDEVYGLILMLREQLNLKQPPKGVRTSEP